MHAVLQTAISDGDPNRTDRKVLFDNNLKKVGISHGDHKLCGKMTVMVFNGTSA